MMIKLAWVYILANIYSQEISPNGICIFNSTNCTNCATIKLWRWLDKSHRLLLFDEMLYKSNCCLFPLFSFGRIFFDKKNPFVYSLFLLIPSFLANRRNRETRSSFDSDWEHISRVLCYLDTRHLYQERMILSTGWLN